MLSQMIPLLCLSSPIQISTTIILSKTPSFFTQTHHLPRLRSPISQLNHFTINSIQNDPQNLETSSYEPKPRFRTLFPGGYKRAEIKVPNIVLQVNANEVLGDGSSVLDLVDGAVAKWVGIVVVNNGGDGGGGGGELYEAACLLKSVVRDRAYLLVDERVDIASAVNATGVVLSDQGLPAIVARTTMMGSKSESVVLPVVGRSVKTVNAALSASNSEGADFLICRFLVEEWSDLLMQTVSKNVKIPTFVEMTCFKNDISFNNVSKLLMSGVSGFVMTLNELMSTGDVLGKIFYDASLADKKVQDDVISINNLEMLNTTNGFSGGGEISSFVKVDDIEARFIKKEKSLLVEAVNAIEKAAPLMEEISLLNDAISQLDEPFMLVIVGEFNSGKSSVINALLGGKFLKEGVVPTTNEITFLRYSEFDSNEQQRCEKHPDGQYICYLSSEILKKMIIVDTPGTNVILQRQQRLTEEFLPRADLLLFVLSADRPLTESEVSFLRYTQQWKKKVVFLLNKADLYQNPNELDEAMAFVSENVKKLLIVDHVKLFPVSSRSALKAKLGRANVTTDQSETSMSETCSSSHRFDEFENFLLDLLDGSTNAGLERMKIKLETPLGIAERLLSSCQTLVTQDIRYARKDLMSVKELIGAVQEYAPNMENESDSWRRQISSLVKSAKGRVLNLVESTLQLSNLDLAVSIIFRSDKSASAPTTLSMQNDIIGPALSDAKMLVQGYISWLKENHVSEATQYKETFEKKWPSFVASTNRVELKANYVVMETDGQSLQTIEKLSANPASKLLDQEIREVFFGAFGGLGAAGLSASLLTSVLPTTLEDLLALGLCSAGGLLAISNFPARRQKLVDKVNKIADAVEQELKEAMRKDLTVTTKSLEDFVALVGKPYEEAAQQRLDELVDTQQHLSHIEKKLQMLRVELQNLHLS